jgi:hypothetical protein
LSIATQSEFEPKSEFFSVSFLSKGTTMFEFLESILFELKNIPGLSFLKNIHAALAVKSSRARSKLQAIRNKKNDFSKISKRVGNMGPSGKGSKRRND